MSTAVAFRFRDALRDLVRRPRVASLVIAATLAIALAPLFYYTRAASHGIAAATDGRAAFKAYQLWCAAAIVLGAITSRVAAALVASAMVERRDRPAITTAEATARTLAHGLPAALAALLAVALAGLGVIAMVLAAVPLAAIAFVAGPAAAAEQLGPTAAIRRSAELTRGVRVRLAAWMIALVVVEIAPLVIARYTVYTAKKPPVAPILHAQQLHGAIVIAVVVVAAVVQVVVYRRLRDREPS